MHITSLFCDIDAFFEFEKQIYDPSYQGLQTECYFRINIFRVAAKSPALSK